MIRRSNEKEVIQKIAPFGGAGEVTARNVLNGPEEMNGKGRMFAHNTVHPGSQIGYHVHHGDSETYYILSGTAEYSDNGNIVTLTAGDVAFCPSGQGHSLKCIGDEPVEMIALVLYD